MESGVCHRRSTSWAISSRQRLCSPRPARAPDTGPPTITRSPRAAFFRAFDFNKILLLL